MVLQGPGKSMSGTPPRLAADYEGPRPSDAEDMSQDDIQL